MGMILVAGPPCGGKTTYVNQRAMLQDPVLDWDAVWVELNGGHTRVPYSWTQAERDTEAEFRRRLDAMTHGWVIRCAPNKVYRSLLRRRHKAKSIVLATPYPECIRRLEADPTRQDKARWVRAIEDWWMRYEPSSSSDETVIQTFGVFPETSSGGTVPGSASDFPLPAQDPVFDAVVIQKRVLDAGQ